MERRAWGFWSLHKLDILGDYLSAFNTASKRAGKTVYLDLFAGTPDNESRETGEPVMGSVRRALDAAPPFARLYFFDPPAEARALDAALRAEYPGREFSVIPGDCNTELPHALTDIRSVDLDWAPTFAFLDPDNLNVEWSTLETLAAFKRGRKYKVELWVLCFSSAMPRVLTTRDEPDAVGSQLLTGFFGTDQWREIHRARATDAIDAGQAREEYVNLLRWRLQHVLGYQYTLAFEVKNVRGPLYHLVFATDNDAGFKIMQDLYSKAARDHEPMRREARERERQRRDEERGVRSLFSPEELAGPTLSDVKYHHEPPWPPLGSEGEH
jgi:three-Cys-motif partner protein